MMRIFFAAILLAMMLPVHASEFWANLWHNADQRGDALLQHGDASGAAKVYADPRRIAYAKLKAGDYRGAAQDLGKIHDSDSDYNRGNALALAGDLQGALAAYDAALKSNPNNHDARHNRELVANAMKHQPPQPSGGNKDDKSRQGSDSSGQNKQDDKQGGQQGNRSSGLGKNDEKQAGQQGNNSSGQGKNDDKQGGQQGNNSSGHGKNDDESRQGSPDKNGSQNADHQSGRGTSAQTNPPQQNGPQGGQGEKFGDEKNRNGLSQSGKPENGAQQGVGQDMGNNANTPTHKSEQQIAEEQWLRSIPDDPGGLLRRKFLIEHMIRQSEP